MRKVVIAAHSVPACAKEKDLKKAINAAVKEISARGADVIQVKERKLNGPAEFKGYAPKISWSGPGMEVSFIRGTGMSESQWKASYKLMADVFKWSGGNETANILSKIKDNEFHAIKFLNTDRT